MVVYMKARRRVGLLIPASDIVIEVDLWRHLPPELTLHVARMFLGATTVEGEERMLQEELEPAASRVASVLPEFAVFGCTSASALHGLEGDRAISLQISKLTNCPCTTVIQTIIHEVGLLQINRLLLITPYVDALNHKLINTLRAAGLPVSRASGLGLVDDPAIAAVDPTEIQQYAMDIYSKEATQPDCIFISGTTFRGFDAVEGLEKQLGIPVLSSNLCVLKAIYRHFNLAYP